MTWFKDLFGFREDSPETVQQNLFIAGRLLHSRANGRSWQIGTFETPTLHELRQRPAALPAGSLQVRNITGEAGALHRDYGNRNALFQVASQFNMLEMVSPGVTPEDGITGYEYDYTQGPACALAAAAGTVWRNYFVPLGSVTGQCSGRQINGLADIHAALSPDGRPLWRMRNGYALCDPESVGEFERQFNSLDEAGRDHLRGLLRIGLQWEVEVARPGGGHLVSQAFSSALPLGEYETDPRPAWQEFAQLILEATYECVLAAAVSKGIPTVFLTLVGGGVFGNDRVWIRNAISRALDSVADRALDIRIVHFQIY